MLIWKINPNFCCWRPETYSLAMALAPTISLGLSGILLCEGYSWVHLCQGCVSVLLGTLTVYTETPSQGCRAFLCCIPSARPRWRPRAVLETRKVSAWLGRERQSTLRVPGARCSCGWPQYPRGPRVCQAQLPRSACSNFSLITNWSRRQWKRLRLGWSGLLAVPEASPGLTISETVWARNHEPEK